MSIPFKDHNFETWLWHSIVKIIGVKKFKKDQTDVNSIQINKNIIDNTSDNILLLLLLKIIIIILIITFLACFMIILATTKICPSWKSVCLWNRCRHIIIFEKLNAVSNFFSGKCFDKMSEVWNLARWRLRLWPGRF